MELYNIVEKKCCKHNFKAKNKENVLKKLSDLAVKSDLLEDFSSEDIFNYLSKREKQGSTGFGNEIAIPHARIKGMKEFLVFFISSQKGVDFEALDKKKVKLIFVILGPEERVNDHLQILAGISRTIGTSHSKNEVIKSPSTTAMYEAFIRHTRAINSEGKEKQKMKLLLVNLYIEDFFYNILEFFIEEGIDGATILNSSGMGDYISNIPLFADFIGFMREDKNKSRTILTLVPEGKVDEVINGIEEITGDLDKKQGAMVMVLDIDFYKGSMKMM